MKKTKMTDALRWREFVKWWEIEQKTAWHVDPYSKCIVCKTNSRITELKKEE